MPRSPVSVVEARILAAIRRNGPQTVAELHSRSGLIHPTSGEIEETCQRMVHRGELVGGWRERGAKRWGMKRERVFSLLSGLADNQVSGKVAPCRSVDEDNESTRPTRRHGA